MSDRGDEDNGRHSRNGSMSGHSDDDKRIVTYKSRSKEPSKSASTSPSKLKYRSRSRSRSHHRSRRSRSHRRSRSRSFHRYRSRYSRSFTHSRSGSYSPYRGSSRRRRHTGTRGSHEIKNLMPIDKKSNANYENPKQNKCLGVFGLSIYTTENQLHHIFSKFGGVNKVQVVIDAKSGRSRGFAFVYFDSIEDAKNAKDNCTGMEIDGRKIRVDFSITQRAHTPTPGIYMGKPTYSSDVRWRDDDYYGGGGGGGGSRSSRYDRYSRRSPSPYYSRRRSRYDRSRSRSYSPRVVRRGYG